MHGVGIAIWIAMELASRQVPPPPPSSVEFARHVQPILEKRCQPCHFEGGSMYAELPFDQPATITRLGTRLFTRIRKENEQAVIRAFLAKSGESEAAPRSR